MTKLKKKEENADIRCICGAPNSRFCWTSAGSLQSYSGRCLSPHLLLSGSFFLFFGTGTMMKFRFKKNLGPGLQHRGLQHDPACLRAWVDGTNGERETNPHCGVGGHRTGRLANPPTAEGKTVGPSSPPTRQERCWVHDPECLFRLPFPICWLSECPFLDDYSFPTFQLFLFFWCDRDQTWYWSAKLEYTSGRPKPTIIMLSFLGDQTITLFARLTNWGRVPRVEEVTNNGKRWGNAGWLL